MFFVVQFRNGIGLLEIKSEHDSSRGRNHCVGIDGANVQDESNPCRYFYLERWRTCAELLVQR